MSAHNQRPIYSHQQLQRLKNEERALEARLQNKIDVPKHRGIKETGLSERKKGYFEQFMRDDVREDPGIIKRRLERVRTAIRNGTPPPLSKNERARAEQERRTDEEFLKKNLTSRQLFNARPNTPEFEQGKKACAREMHPAIQRVVDRYVRNTRVLDPDNQERNLVERLRPSR